MGMKKLFKYFKRNVNDMTDEDIKKSISKAAALDDFITYVKDEYGLTVEPVESDDPDSFEKIG